MDQAKAGAFIAQLRKEAKLTQAQLGERVGVTNKTVSRWENGNYMPDLDVCLQLSELFGVTVNELLLGQRLSDGDLRQSANQVMAGAIHHEMFSVKEKIRYWKAKWRREHWLLLALLAVGWFCLLIWMHCRLEGLSQWKPLAFGSAGMLGICAYGWQNNRMMTYVEGKVFGEKPQE
ncbi:MAG: helix-turn-helix transcriptional regulator [Clostridia bacterium]|nr:helix-turn-helix transcriptional regulator [Clostridia bacterium]MBP3650495.1 helix-turn-helix transcriptional regulator [Clostridia bacterium]